MGQLVSLGQKLVGTVSVFILFTYFLHIFYIISTQFTFYIFSTVKKAILKAWSGAGSGSATLLTKVSPALIKFRTVLLTLKRS